jgi:hypothetical protein
MRRNVATPFSTIHSPTQWTEPNAVQCSDSQPGRFQATDGLPAKSLFSCQVVTRGLSWVVLVVQNSARGKQSTRTRPSRLSTLLFAQPESQLLIANDNPTRIVILSDQRESKGLPSRSLPLLIANLELEFHISPIRIIELRFSNRKYSQLFHSPWRIVEGAQARCPHRSNSNSRITEKELSRTKERRKQNSNSNKIAISPNSALHAFSQLAARCRVASVTDPLSSAPNLAIIDFPTRGHL